MQILFTFSEVLCQKNDEEHNLLIDYLILDSVKRDLKDIKRNICRNEKCFVLSLPQTGYMPQDETLFSI